MNHKSWIIERLHDLQIHNILRWVIVQTVSHGQNVWYDYNNNHTSFNITSLSDTNSFKHTQNRTPKIVHLPADISPKVQLQSPNGDVRRTKCGDHTFFRFIIVPGFDVHSVSIDIYIYIYINTLHPWTTIRIIPFPYPLCVWRLWFFIVFLL